MRVQRGISPIMAANSVQCLRERHQPFWTQDAAKLIDVTRFEK